MANFKPKQVDCSRGAPMGRTEHHITNAGPVTLRLVKLPLDSGGYDSGGAYWGLRSQGISLYHFWWQSPTHNRADIISGYIDAISRDQAKALIRETYPEARFGQ